MKILYFLKLSVIIKPIFARIRLVQSEGLVKCCLCEWFTIVFIFVQPRTQFILPFTFTKSLFISVIERNRFAVLLNPRFKICGVEEIAANDLSIVSVNMSWVIALAFAGKNITMVKHVSL